MSKKSYFVAATALLIVVLTMIWGVQTHLAAKSWRLLSNAMRGAKDSRAMSYQVSCPYHEDCINIIFESPDDLSYIERLFQNHESSRGLPRGGILELSARFNGGESRRFVFVEYDGLWVAEYDYFENPSDRAYPTMFFATPPNRERWDRILDLIRVHHSSDTGHREN